MILVCEAGVKLLFFHLLLPHCKKKPQAFPIHSKC